MLPGFVPLPPEDVRRYREAGYFDDRPLGELLLDAAARFPDRTAVVSGETRLTYQELAGEVERIAAGLLELGIAPLDRVVVQLPNITEFVTLVGALFLVGAIPVMALPGHRANEITHLCRHCDAVAYVVKDRFQGFDYRVLARTVKAEVPELREVLVVGDAQEFRAFADVSAPPCELPAVDPGSPALFLLSGGTTGLPKPIPRTHNDYAYNMLESARMLEVDEHGVYLAVNPIAHNAALGCPGVIGTLLVGGTAVLAPNPSPDEVFGLIRLENVTLTTLVPALVRLWIKAAESEPVDLSGLLLQVGSAMFSPDLAAEAVKVLGCRLTRWFGIAEGLLTCTRLDDPDDVVFATDGRPVAPHDEIRVVDPDTGEPVATGEEGELLARGPYTIRGYFNAPEQNARSFTSEGFFRTGDLVRMTTGGNIVVTGRIKDVVNRGGDKIPAAEVEGHLDAHPGIRESALVGVVDERLGERTCAFMVAVDGAVPQHELRAFLMGRGLAAYKIPDQAVWVDALPRTPVGKADKNALRAAVPVP